MILKDKNINKCIIVYHLLTRIDDFYDDMIES